MIEESCVGRDVGAGRAADGFLVDAHHTPDGREIALDRPSEFIGLVSEEQGVGLSAFLLDARGVSLPGADEGGQDLTDKAGLPRP